MQCQCLPSPSPRKEDKRDGREIFDFTSKKLSNQGNSKTLRRKKEHKIDITVQGIENHGAIKSPRRTDERNIFDFSVKKDTQNEGIYGRTTYSRREVLDFTSGID